MAKKKATKASRAARTPEQATADPEAQTPEESRERPKPPKKAAKVRIIAPFKSAYVNAQAGDELTAEQLGGEGEARYWIAQGNAQAI
jgi:hypothetical protein